MNARAPHAHMSAASLPFAQDSENGPDPRTDDDAMSVFRVLKVPILFLFYSLRYN